MPLYFHSFILKPSYALLALLLLLHAGAIAIAWCLEMPIALSLIITAACLWSLWRTVQEHIVRRANKAIVKLWAEQGGKWQLQSYDGSVYSVELAGGVRSNTFALLNFKVANKYRKLSVLIWRDALDVDSFRRLRVLLRFSP